MLADAQGHVSIKLLIYLFLNLCTHLFISFFLSLLIYLFIHLFVVCFCLFCLHIVTVPVKPPTVSAQPLSATSISVQWSFDHSFQNVLGILKGFKVHHVKVDGVNYTVVTVSDNKSTVKLANLQPFTKYNVTVGAFTQAGETKSSPVIVGTLQDGRFYNDD